VAVRVPAKVAVQVLVQVLAQVLARVLAQVPVQVLATFLRIQSSRQLFNSSSSQAMPLSHS
jgi:hypothetical protein